MKGPDADVLRGRLSQLADHIARIEAKRPASLDALAKDRDLQDILSKNIESAVQVCLDIAAHVCAARGRAVEKASDAFTVLAELGMIGGELARKLVRAVGFRNVSVHRYAEIDWSVVMTIAEEDIEDLKRFARWAATLATEPPGSPSAG
ncbi:MAG: DUF86 domain-containing protein [Betaproteobacteria bacterium]|nr:DUF86 domain-containing protein [Betaproteobacteria bacterium]